jgi:hypothetical protein
MTAATVGIGCVTRRSSCLGLAAAAPPGLQGQRELTVFPRPAWHPSAGREQRRVPPTGVLTPRGCCAAAPYVAPQVPVGVRGSCGAAPRALHGRAAACACARRYGFVTFERKDDAQRALAMCRQNQFLVGASPMPALVELARIEARRSPPRRRGQVVRHAGVSDGMAWARNTCLL